MLTLPPHVRIYACVAACDMRKQFDGLATLVQQGMGRNPRSGDMYVFRNRRADMLKILFFDQQGYCLLAKRMDRHTFKLTANADSSTLEISGTELAALMSGAAVVKQG